MRRSGLVVLALIIGASLAVASPAAAAPAAAPALVGPVCSGVHYSNAIASGGKKATVAYFVCIQSQWPSVEAWIQYWGTSTDPNRWTDCMAQVVVRNGVGATVGRGGRFCITVIRYNGYHDQLGAGEVQAVHGMRFTVTGHVQTTWNGINLADPDVSASLLVP